MIDQIVKLDFRASLDRRDFEKQGSMQNTIMFMNNRNCQYEEESQREIVDLRDAMKNDEREINDLRKTLINEEQAVKTAKMRSDLQNPLVGSGNVFDDAKVREEFREMKDEARKVKDKHKTAAQWARQLD